MNKYKILSLIGMVGGAVLGLVGNFADEKIMEKEIEDQVSEKVADALGKFISEKGEE